MIQARCKNGHIYDQDIYGDSCPYCEQHNTTIAFGDNDGEYHFKVQSTPKEKITPDDIKKTAPPPGYAAKQEELKKTVGVYAKLSGIDPVVAWLICVNGHEIGKDYRLTAKTNTIGRSPDNDVCIKGDDTITKDTHAKIDYDILNNKFYLIPANNKNTIYLNNAPVYVPQVLNAYDMLRFGQTELHFLPYCSDKFVWPEKKGGDN